MKVSYLLSKKNYDQDNATDACHRPLNTKIKRIKSNTSETKSTNNLSTDTGLNIGDLASVKQNLLAISFSNLFVCFYLIYISFGFIAY